MADRARNRASRLIEWATLLMAALAVLIGVIAAKPKSASLPWYLTLSIAVAAVFAVIALVGIVAVVVGESHALQVVRVKAKRSHGRMSTGTWRTHKQQNSEGQVHVRLMAPTQPGTGWLATRRDLSAVKVVCSVSRDGKRVFDNQPEFTGTGDWTVAIPTPLDEGRYVVAWTVNDEQSVADRFVIDGTGVMQPSRVRRLVGRAAWWWEKDRVHSEDQ